MYLDFFKLQQLPFRLTADPRFHFESAERAQAKALLLAALTEGGADEDEGCLLVSGDAGVGKTILVNDVLGRLQDQFVVVQIRQPELSVAEFRAAVIAELEGNAANLGGTAGSGGLDACLAKQAAAGRTVVLALDNGEAFGEALVDEIFRLARRDGAANRNLKVILAARVVADTPGRRKRFNDWAGASRLHVRLAALTEQESRRYVEHRLRVAGRVGTAIFRDDAYLEIQRFTGGVPRLINTLADATLMAGFNRNHDAVTAAEIRAAVNQLKWVEFDSRLVVGDVQVPMAEQAVIGHLRIEHANVAVADFDLPLGKLSLGRAMNNDVRIYSKYVSRNHCQIVTSDRYSVIEDLQSQNGILMASRRVSVHRLQDGDSVEIGDLTLVYSSATVPKGSRPQAFPVTVVTGPLEPDTGQTGLISSAPSANDAVNSKKTL